MKVLIVGGVAGGASAAARIRRLDEYAQSNVRTEGEYQRGHLNGFRNIPLDDLREHLDELDQGKPVYVNCQTGLRCSTDIKVCHPLYLDCILSKGIVYPAR